MIAARRARIAQLGLLGRGAVVLGAQVVEGPLDPREQALVLGELQEQPRRRSPADRGDGLAPRGSRPRRLTPSRHTSELPRRHPVGRGRRSSRCAAAGRIFVPMGFAGGRMAPVLDATQHPERRTDLDWLRVIAVLIVLFFHTGMMFVPWSWHVKSPERSLVLEIVMLWLHVWRMPLLLFVSGAGTFLALRHRSALRVPGRAAPQAARPARLRLLRDRATPDLHGADRSVPLVLGVLSDSVRAHPLPQGRQLLVPPPLVRAVPARLLRRAPALAALAAEPARRFVLRPAGAHRRAPLRNPRLASPPGRLAASPRPVVAGRDARADGRSTPPWCGTASSSWPGILVARDPRLWDAVRRERRRNLAVSRP